MKRMSTKMSDPGSVVREGSLAVLAPKHKKKTAVIPPPDRQSVVRESDIPASATVYHRDKAQDPQSVVRKSDIKKRRRH